LNTVRGYKIPFVRPPVQIHVQRNCIFNESESKEVQKSVDKLLSLGSIVETIHTPGEFISTIFLVPKPDGSFRFILNLKKLNKFLEHVHFKMEDHRTVLRLMTKGCYFASIDLKEAYNLIPIYKEHRKFLRFIWNGKLYEFSCLAFGLSTGPRVFTKLLKPVIAFLRSNGITLVIYIDDILIIGSSYDDCKSSVDRTIEVLESLGFVINRCKSQLSPSQVIRYLGFIFDSNLMSISLPTDKRHKIVKLCSTIKRRRSVTVQKFSEFIGLLISACPAVPYGMLYTKIFERSKFLSLRAGMGNYESKIIITEEIISDIDWWEKTIPVCSQSIRPDTYSLEIFSDASKTGWGLACGDCKSHGWWSNDETQEHINVLELIAAYYGVKCYASQFKKTQLLLRIDNTTAISYINRMGGIQFPKYNQLARKIWQFCEKRELWVFASYIASKANIIADRESRSTKYHTEWEISPIWYNQIRRRFGQPDMDLFASNQNSKCTRYVSWLPDPHSVNVDAFTMPWKGIKFYAFPPFSLILRTLQKIKREESRGIVVVPFWPNQPWFPLFQALTEGNPIYSGPSDDLLVFMNRKHPLRKTLILVAATLSGQHLSNKEPQRTQ